jgi:hypothetical protein
LGLRGACCAILKGRRKDNFTASTVAHALVLTGRRGTHKCVRHSSPRQNVKLFLRDPQGPRPDSALPLNLKSARIKITDMKHVRRDRVFVYYLDRQLDGTYVGIRVGRGLAWIIKGDSNNPEMLQIHGNPEKVPMAREGSHEFAEILRMLAPPDSELDRLLSGQLRFSDVATFD